MAKKVFYLNSFDKYSKYQNIVCGAGDLNLSVDYDDVDHYQTAVLLKKALVILNEHWNDPKYFSYGFPLKYEEAATIMKSLTED